MLEVFSYDYEAYKQLTASMFSNRFVLARSVRKPGSQQPLDEPAANLI